MTDGAGEEEGRRPDGEEGRREGRMGGRKNKTGGGMGVPVRATEALPLLPPFSVFVGRGRKGWRGWKRDRMRGGEVWIGGA